MHLYYITDLKYDQNLRYSKKTLRIHILNIMHFFLGESYQKSKFNSKLLIFLMNFSSQHKSTILKIQKISLLKKYFYNFNCDMLRNNKLIKVWLPIALSLDAMYARHGNKR